MPNDGCTKCVINDKKIAIIAPELAAELGAGHPNHADIVRLGKIAQMATDIYDSAIEEGVLTLNVDAKNWPGCEHAVTLTEWMLNGGNDPAMQSKLTAWRREILVDLAKFLEGHEAAK